MGRAFGFCRAVVGDGVQGASFSHTLSFVIDDDSGGGVLALEADRNGAVGEVARGFKAHGLEGEGVVGADLALVLDEEEFIVGLIGRKEADAGAIQGEAIQRAHAQHGMDLGVVLFLDPLGKLAVERFEGGKVQLQAQEALAHPAKKALHFSLRRAITHRGMGQEAADPGTDLNDFLGGINGSVIDVEASRHPALVESGAQGLDEGIDIFGWEELAVTTDARGVIQESDETGLNRDALASIKNSVLF